MADTDALADSRDYGLLLFGGLYWALIGLPFVAIGVCALGVPSALLFRKWAQSRWLALLGLILGAAVGAVSISFLMGGGPPFFQASIGYDRLYQQIALTGATFGGAAGLASWYFLREPTARQRLD
ncbi:hypothetical protein [Paraurantiacibacter namhicola]|uniref:hypothetical protein n=1 Tax=Paraurantiacibacter namhicola TaxID=645517 RepID=UPI0008313BCA|nr:hypothetical protein [Paraurantiacibacter namhicola]